jgi:predicted nucleic acid-binding Zn ribbon protein
MKQCAYCGKEIDYHEMYCSDKCEDEAQEFFDLREKTQSVFSAVNGICVLGIGVSIFVYAFLQDFGVIMGTALLMALGVLYFFLPFPAEVMVNKYKLKKAIILTRYIAIALFLLGLAVLILHFLHVL